MNVGVWGEGPLSDAVRGALPGAGHAVAAGRWEDGTSALVVFPPGDMEQATRGTYELLCGAAGAGVRRVVVVSTLAFFARCPRNWKLTPAWRPRPGTDLSELCPWLTELSAREITRATALHTRCLRLGGDVPADAALAAVLAALDAPLREERPHDWTVEHVGEPAGRPAADDRPWQEVLAPQDPVPSRTVRRVAIFGAGGPLGAALAQELAPRYRLRMTDARAIEDIFREGKPQKEGAPLPLPAERLEGCPHGPHESRVVDVRDAAQVRDACTDVDAIVNCSVVRRDPADAFRVNTLGAYHLARAAVAHRIRRVLQTGPELLSLLGVGDYSWDYEVAGDPPTRPGCHLYAHSKFLGQETLRVFAEWHGLDVPNLLFSKFGHQEIGNGFYPMMVSWRDAARALRLALEVPSLPSPYEEFHVTAPLPHGRFRSDKLERLLGWQARDGLERFWQNDTP